jgi:hypothetical protein
MKVATLCCFTVLVFSTFARSDSQISPTISPDLLVIFFELWRDSGYGRHPARTEESAWILKNPYNNYSTIRWPATGKKNAHFWRGPVPNGVVALAHTHTVKAYSKPSRMDISESKRLQIPFYIISDKGIWIVDQGNVKKILGGDWDNLLPILRIRQSFSD